MQGGQYVLKNGKRELVSRTESIEERKEREAKEKAKAEAKAKKGNDSKEG